MRQLLTQKKPKMQVLFPVVAEKCECSTVTNTCESQWAAHIFPACWHISILVLFRALPVWIFLYFCRFYACVNVAIEGKKRRKRMQREGSAKPGREFV